MNGDAQHPPRPAWRARVEKLIVLVACVVFLSGALAAVYFRPHGHKAPGHVGLALAAVAVLRITHCVSAWTAVALAMIVAVLGRPWRRHYALVAGFAMLAAFLASGLVTPWERLLPWSVPLGANMARPMPLFGHDGPFPELVGVNVTYDDTVLAIGRLRLGARGVGRLYVAHAVGLPLAAAALAGFGLWRRRRSRVRG